MRKEANVEAIYSLSPLQQGILFHAVNEPKSGLYVSQLICNLHGDLNEELLRRTWQELLDRHPVLRTAFLWERTGKMLEAVIRRVPLRWRSEDLRGIAHPDQAKLMNRLLEQDRAQAYDLVQPPLMRVILVRLGEQEYRLIWSHHHLLLDGWSGAMLMNEAWTIYTARARNEEPQLAVRRPYSDYISWLAKQDLAQAETFWRGELAGFRTPTRLAMQIDAMPSEPQRRIARIESTLSAETTARLTGQARKLQLTLNTLAQGAWALVMALYSGESDVVFGAIAAARPPDLRGIESMVGMFINTLPVRAKIDRARPAGEWLSELQRRHAQSRRFDYAPLSRIQNWCDATRRGQPLFDSALTFFNYPVEASHSNSACGVEFRGAYAEERTNFGLLLGVSPGRELSAALSFDSAKFAETDARKLLDHFCLFLEELGAKPDGRLRDVSLMRDEHRRRVLKDFNATETVYEPVCAHEQFRRQALRTPSAIAVEHNGQQMSYAALDERSDRIACGLRRSGIGLDKLVCVFLERGLDMVVAVLSVLKAGGAYVPIDPGYPANRVRMMVEDSRAGVVLTSAWLAECLSGNCARIVLMEDLASGGDDDDVASMPTAAAGPGNLAYIIYTSGSTGSPKGVMVTHRALANHLFHVHEEPSLSGEDVLVSIASLSFDISVLELFLPLTVGARVVIADRHTGGDPAALAKLVDDCRATFLQATPVTWRTLVSSGWNGNPRLRTLSGGDTLAPDVAAALVERCAGLHNAYGPTETTIYCTMSPIEKVSGPLPVGRPMKNTQIFVTNPEFDLLPEGAPGEILIGGDCLARGYLHRPALTAERFVPNPFGPAGSRMYRSGDLGAWNPDGSLQFCGRIDRQIKVQGFRIELGEVEAALRRHESVAQCVVTACDNDRGGKRLVAYIVPRDKPAGVGELRDFIRTILPDYMAPHEFMFLSALPLTPNAKVDHRALPPPDANRTARGSGGHAPPRTPLEYALAALWMQLLGVERVGIHDDFFETGGDSLLALEHQAKVRELFALDRPLPSVFETSTIAKLAQHLTTASSAAASGGKHLVVLTDGLHQRDVRLPFICVHPVGGGIACYRTLSKLLPPDQPFYAIQSADLLQVGSLGEIYRRFEDMAATYVDAVRSAQPRGPYLLGGWSYGAIVSYEMARQLSAAGEEVRMVAIIDMPAAESMKLTAISDETLMIALVHELGEVAQPRKQFSIDAAELAAVPSNQRANYVLDRLKSARLVAESTTVETVRRLLSGYRSRQALLAKYRLLPWPGPLAVFRSADTDDELLLAEVGLTDVRKDPALGWRGFSPNVQAHEIPGNHRTMLVEPNVRRLAEALNASIEAAVERAGASAVFA